MYNESGTLLVDLAYVQKQATNRSWSVNIMISTTIERRDNERHITRPESSESTTGTGQEFTQSSNGGVIPNVGLRQGATIEDILGYER